MRTGDDVTQNCTLTYEYVVASWLGWIQSPEIPDLSLQANVGDETVQGVGLEARHVAGVRVAIGIAVSGVEEQRNVVAFGDGVGGGFTLGNGDEVVSEAHGECLNLSVQIQDWVESSLVGFCSVVGSPFFEPRS